MYLNSKKPVILSVMWIGLLLVTSCQPRILRNLKQVSPGQTTEKIHLLNDSLTEWRYRAHVEAFGQNMSGIFIMKKSETGYRAFLMTDFGLKVLDFLLLPNGDYEVNHIMEHMNYKFIKENLAQNLIMLLPPDPYDELRIFSIDSTEMLYSPEKKMIYFANQNAIFKVERLNNRKNTVATTQQKDNAAIEILQPVPGISILLKPLN
jgi:hypothetical protein